jgi:hypothetical protein
MKPWVAAQDGDIGQAFERFSDLSTNTETAAARSMLVQIVHAWTVHNRDGVILTVDGPTPKFLSIEFYGPFRSPNGVPNVQIQASQPLSLERARCFFDSDDDIVVLNCTESVFDEIAAHLKKNSARGKNLVDIKSGAPLIEGYITPLN